MKEQEEIKRREKMFAERQREEKLAQQEQERRETEALEQARLKRDERLQQQSRHSPAIVTPLNTGLTNSSSAPSMDAARQREIEREREQERRRREAVIFTFVM